MFNTLLYQPLLKILIVLTGVFGGSFGWAIIALTAMIRTILLPLSLPAMRSAQKMQNLKPQLDELKKRHSGDKRRLQQEQLQLFKQEGINPAAGCLPTLIQFAVLIALYRVFMDFIEKGKLDSSSANLNFFYLNLARPDHLYILPILAGVTQLLLSVMLMPGKEHHTTEDLTRKAREKEGLEKKDKEEDVQDMASAMQQQMLYVMPVMTALIALKLPSGLAVYWVATTLFSIGQQYLVSGLGGLRPWVEKLAGRRKYGEP